MTSSAGSDGLRSRAHRAVSAEARETYRAFRDAVGPEFDALDRACEAFTLLERSLGAFDFVPPPPGAFDFVPPPPGA